MTSRLHWGQCRKYELESERKCHRYKQEVIENDQFKILRDFNTKTDNILQTVKPDTTVFEKKITKTNELENDTSSMGLLWSTKYQSQ